MPRYTRNPLTRAATCNQKSTLQGTILAGCFFICQKSAFFTPQKHLTFVALNVIMFLGYRKRGENMVAKLGRPTNNPKNAPVHVRLDNKCTAILEQYCRQENISRAEAIRKGIMKLESDIKE